MSGNLFLDGIFNGGDSPNKVQISLPEWDANSGKSLSSSLVGLLASEFTLSSQNKWGPILSDVSNLTDLSSLMGDNEVFSWIGASVQCWKGTEPLKFSLDFYLINYTKGLGLEKKLSSLVKLTSLSRSNSLSDVKVAPHGGYSPNVLTPNKSIFDNSGWSSLDTEMQESIKASMKDYGESLWSTAGSGTEAGTVKLKLGSKMTIANLLVARVDVTPSLVEVATQDGGDPKPLYYRVSASFTGTKPLLSEDVSSIYGDI